MHACMYKPEADKGYCLYCHGTFQDRLLAAQASAIAGALFLVLRAHGVEFRVV